MAAVCKGVVRRRMSGPSICVVMVSAAPFGIILRGIVMHAGVSRVSACVNGEWLQAVRAVICELRRGFVGSGFYVECLWPDAFDEDKAKRRLQRVLKLRFGNESIPDATLWWYNTQLYLHYAITKRSMSFQDLLYRCYIFLCTQGMISVYLKVFIVITSPHIQKRFWQLGFSVMRDLS